MYGVRGIRKQSSQIDNPLWLQGHTSSECEKYHKTGKNLDSPVLGITAGKRGYPHNVFLKGKNLLLWGVKSLRVVFIEK